MPATAEPTPTTTASTRAVVIRSAANSRRSSCAIPTRVLRWAMGRVMPVLHRPRRTVGRAVELIARLGPGLRGGAAHERPRRMLKGYREPLRSVMERFRRERLVRGARADAPGTVRRAHPAAVGDQRRSCTWCSSSPTGYNVGLRHDIIEVDRGHRIPRGASTRSRRRHSRSIPPSPTSSSSAPAAPSPRASITARAR